jgi:hypothetical protein
MCNIAGGKPILPLFSTPQDVQHDELSASWVGFNFRSEFAASKALGPRKSLLGFPASLVPIDVQ